MDRINHSASILHILRMGKRKGNYDRSAKITELACFFWRDNMKSKREAGYYWVRLNGCKGWTPVYWCSDENDWELSPDWWFTGVCEVNENRLQEPS